MIKKFKFQLIIIMISFLVVSIGGVYSAWKFTTSSTQTLRPEKEMGNTNISGTIEYHWGKIVFLTDITNLQVNLTQGEKITIKEPTDIKDPTTGEYNYKVNASLIGLNEDIQIKFIPNSPTHVWEKDEVPNNLYYDVLIPSIHFKKIDERSQTILFDEPIFIESNLQPIPLNFDINSGIAIIPFSSLQNFCVINPNLTINNVAEYNQLKKHVSSRDFKSFIINITEGISHT